MRYKTQFMVPMVPDGNESSFYGRLINYRKEQCEYQLGSMIADNCKWVDGDGTYTLRAEVFSEKEWREFKIDVQAIIHQSKNNYWVLQIASLLKELENKNSINTKNNERDNQSGINCTRADEQGILDS